MKNILDILKGLGIDVPTDKESDLTKEVAENYKTVAEFDKKVSKMQADIDKATERATSAEETLKGFEGKDFDSITQERDSWQKKYEDKIKADEEAKSNAEFDAEIEEAVANAKGKNLKAIKANLDLEKLKASHNRKSDIADAIKSLSESKENAFLFETDPESKRAKFTDSVNGNGGNGGKTLTKADIYAKDDRGRYKYSTAERQRMIAENPDVMNA